LKTTYSSPFICLHSSLCIDYVSEREKQIHDTLSEYRIYKKNGKPTEWFEFTEHNKKLIFDVICKVCSLNWELLDKYKILDDEYSEHSEYIP
jgi:hypothetical protein